MPRLKLYALWLKRGLRKELIGVYPTLDEAFRALRKAANYVVSANEIKLPPIITPYSVELTPNITLYVSPYAPPFSKDKTSDVPIALKYLRFSKTLYYLRMAERIAQNPYDAAFQTADISRFIRALGGEREAEEELVRLEKEARKRKEIRFEPVEPPPTNVRKYVRDMMSLIRMPDAKLYQPLTSGRYYAIIVRNKISIYKHTEPDSEEDKNLVAEIILPEEGTDTTEVVEFKIAGGDVITYTDDPKLDGLITSAVALLLNLTPEKEAIDNIEKEVQE